MKDVAYRKILVTTDGSGFAAEAFPYALSLAKKYHADLLLLRTVHSIESLSKELGIASIYTSVVPYEDVFKIVNENKRLAKSKLEKIRDEFIAGNISEVKSYVKEGNAEDVIVDVAKVEKCDLIVMATHGVSGLKRAFIGSVADYVICHAPCPVLFIRPKDK